MLYLYQQRINNITNNSIKQAFFIKFVKFYKTSRTSQPTADFAMVIFDLDHFKSANDTYGHMFGDEVLKFIADKLRARKREKPTATLLK